MARLVLAQPRRLDARSPRLAIALVGLLAGLAFALRLDYLGVPLDTDEGGYAYAALNWGRGADLYREVWADRPQGLFLTYRALVGIAPEPWAVRLGAALAAAAIAALLAAIAWALRGPRAAVLAAAVYAVVSVGPRIQGFAFNGELAASLPATAAVAVTVVAARREGRTRVSLLILAGVLGALGTTMKQSGWDGLVVALAVAAALPARTGLRGRAGPVLAVVAGAALPLTASAVHGLLTGWDDYWFAVAGYRLSAPSGAAGDLGARWDRLAGTLPKGLLDLWPLLVGTAVGLAGLRRHRGSPLALVGPVWLAAALAGFALGAQYYPHYYVQLVPPLVLLAVLGATSVRRPALRLALAAVLIVPAAAQVGYLLTLPDDRLDRWVMDDDRLLANRTLAPWLEARTDPDERIYAFVTSADLYFLTDRRSPYPYLWLYNVLEIPGARERLRRTLEAPDGPAWVVLYQRPADVDPTGGLERALTGHYREVTRIEGIPVLQRVVGPEGV